MGSEGLSDARDMAARAMAAQARWCGVFDTEFELLWENRSFESACPEAHALGGEASVLVRRAFNGECLDTPASTILHVTHADDVPRSLALELAPLGWEADAEQDGTDRGPRQVLVSIEDRSSVEGEIARLREAEERFLGLSEAAGEYYWELDAVGRCCFLTKPIETVLGRPIADVIGHMPFEFMPDDEALRFGQWFQELTDECAPFRDLEIRIVRPDGSEHWQAMSGRPVFAPDGSFSGCRGSGLDITEHKHDELERERLRRRLDRAVRATRDGLFEWPDLTRDEILVAPRLAHDLGLPADSKSRIAQVLSRVLTADRRCLRRALRNHLQKGDPFEVEFRSRCASKHFVVRGEATYDTSGALSMIGSVRDVTEHHRDVQFLRMAVSAANEGLWEWDVGTGQCTLDPTWFTMLGYAPEAFPAHISTWQRLVHPDDRPAADAAIKACFSNETDKYRSQFRMRCADGGWLWIEAIGECTRDAETGDVLRMVGVHVDVDDRRRAVEDLATAKQAAELASRAKSEFLANMSHEIRTPMTAILGFADLALDEDTSLAERRNRLETVRRNGRHLLAILGDILDLSKIEAGKLEVETVAMDLPALLEEVRTSMAIRANDKGIQCSLELEPDLPQTIRSDPLRIRQILLNLVGNAVKFTDSGCVSVRARVRRDDNLESHLMLTIEDTGLGMDEEQIKRVFSPFTQADSSTTRQFGGSGLGLTICRRLVDLLGGSISVRSQLDVGTEFCVEIPIAICTAVPDATRSVAKAVATATRTGAVPSLAGELVLLAEDGDDNRRLLVHFLEKAGARIDVAKDGHEAFEMGVATLSGAPPYALIIMDMQMPRMDGYESTRRLREAGLQVPILALTAHAMRGDAERCLAAGCDSYSTKPIGARKLAALCHGLIEQDRADRVAIGPDTTARES